MVEDLGDRELEVLERVSEYGKSTVTTLRETFWWADKNQHVHYRLDKLENRGLVETWKDDEGDHRGSLPPRRARITEEGEEVLEVAEGEEGGADSVEERVERLEKQLEPIRDSYAEIKKRVADLERDVENQDGDIEDVAEDVRELRRAVEQLPTFSSEDEFEFADGD